MHYYNNYLTIVDFTGNLLYILLETSYWKSLVGFTGNLTIVDSTGHFLQILLKTSYWKIPVNFTGCLTLQILLANSCRFYLTKISWLLKQDKCFLQEPILFNLLNKVMQLAAVIFSCKWHEKFFSVYMQLYQQIY